MDNQKLIKELSTWNQQMSTLRKVKKYQESILFYEITDDWFNKMINHFKSRKARATHNSNYG
jgi:hypothetical protein